MNLYEEIETMLDKYNKKIEDIRWVSVENKNRYVDNYYFCIEVNEFLKIAKTTEYDDGYGCVEIHSGLKIVGDDWWLERRSYDGSEWFEFKTFPTKPIEIRQVTKLRYLEDYLECDEED